VDDGETDAIGVAVAAGEALTSGVSVVAGVTVGPGETIREPGLPVLVAATGDGEAELDPVTAEAPARSTVLGGASGGGVASDFILVRASRAASLSPTPDQP
jgi:hypothetical protein